MSTVAVVGAGSAGWLAACALSRALRHRGLEVRVIGSQSPADEPRVRWTLPSLRALHAMLGIPEQEFVRATAATYKLGMEHRGWQGEGSRFAHAHGDLGTDFNGTPFYKYLVREAQQGRGLIPEEFSIASRAALLGRFARPMGDERSMTASFTYGYQFDDRQYAQLLQRLAVRLRVAHVAADVASVEPAGDGGIAALRLSNGERLEADLYLDCSGAAATLISTVDKSPRLDWRANFPCDRMLSGFAPANNDAPAMTQTLANEHGWFWRAPLAHRTAHGFAYASGLLGDDEALRRLQGTQTLDSPQVIRLQAGRRAAPWTGKCVALGAAAMQLEPLAGTDLQAVALGIGTLIELFPVGAASPVEAAEYNRVMAEHLDGLRDFTLAHYHGGAAPAGELWTQLRSAPLPDRLAHKLELYFASARLQLFDFETYEETDWAWLLLGGRQIPRALEVQVQQRLAQVPPERISQLREQVAHLVSTMPRHMDVVRHQNQPAAGGRTHS